MKSAVIVFPGSNCDRDAARALTRISGTPATMVWHKETTLPAGTDLVVLPGGFSYGDYLRCGAMAARSPIMREVVARADKGTAVVGVCNGFQILCEAGLLPGVLLSNAGLKFICRDVHLKVANSQTMFTHRYSAGQVVRFPVAHHDGNYFADGDTLKRLEDGDQIAFRYCDATGAITEAANPNGAVANIAGVFNTTKTIMGMMPHPENAVVPHVNGHQGTALFQSLVEALA